MPWVYILRGASGRHYIGSTTDLVRRFSEHQRGHTQTTKRLGGNLEVIASKQVSTLNEARRMERELKRTKNPAYAMSLLQGPNDHRPR